MCRSDDLQTLRLQVEWYHAPWLRALPLDESQVEEVVAEDYSVFSYSICIDESLVERLSLISDFITILEPQWLADRLSPMESDQV